MRSWIGTRAESRRRISLPVLHGHPQMGAARPYGSITCADSPTGKPLRGQRIQPGRVVTLPGVHTGAAGVDAVHLLAFIVKVSVLLHS